MALAAAQAKAQDDETSSIPPEEEDFDVDEPRYCYCDEVSYGEMVGCDGDSCSREWFHLKCVGLQKAPSKNGMIQIHSLQREQQLMEMQRNGTVRNVRKS